MIQELLEKLGFSQKEILVYLTLVQRGRLTASELSAAAKLNRTTTYGVLAGLIEKKLVIEDLGAATSVYLPAPGSGLIAYFEKKENEIRKQRELAARAAGEISRLAANQPFQLAKITFVDEAGVEGHLINRTPRWCQNLFSYDCVWRGFQDSRLLQHFPEYFEKLYKQILPQDISQELISEDMPAEMEFQKRFNFPRRRVKIWKSGYDFTYSTWIIGDYVIMLQAKDRPFYLIEMKDPAFAKNLRELFSGFWKLIK